MEPDGITKSSTPERDREDWMRKLGVGRRFLEASLDNYTNKAIADIVRVAIDKSPLNNIYIFGNTGCGKTHLAVAMLRRLYDTGRVFYGNYGMYKKTISFRNMADLIFEIKQTFNHSYGDAEAIFINNFSMTHLLVLDDLGAENVGDWSTQVLYLIVERRYRENYPTIVTSNMTPEELEKSHGSRIASRLCSGELIHITAPDYRKN
jgi:DNA replication protein DnaC